MAPEVSETELQPFLDQRGGGGERWGIRLEGIS